MSHNALATMAAAIMRPANQLGNPQLPPPKIEVEYKLVTCLGCGVLFTREFQPNETCPICLKTVGWKAVGAIKGPVT